MNYVLEPILWKCVVVFLDDVLVYSQTMLDHVNHLKAVFSLLRQHMLYLKMSNYFFTWDTLDFLGQVVSAKGIATDPTKVLIVQKWSIPTCAKDVPSFLGMACYYRKFV